MKCKTQKMSEKSKHKIRFFVEFHQGMHMYKVCTACQVCHTVCCTLCGGIPIPESVVGRWSLVGSACPERRQSPGWWPARRLRAGGRLPHGAGGYQPAEVPHPPREEVPGVGPLLPGTSVILTHRTHDPHDPLRDRHGPSHGGEWRTRRGSVGGGFCRRMAPLCWHLSWHGANWSGGWTDCLSLFLIHLSRCWPGMELRFAYFYVSRFLHFCVSHTCYAICCIFFVHFSVYLFTFVCIFFPHMDLLSSFRLYLFHFPHTFSAFSLHCATPFFLEADQPEAPPRRTTFAVSETHCTSQRRRLETFYERRFCGRFRKPPFLPPSLKHLMVKSPFKSLQILFALFLSVPCHSKGY